MQHVRYKLTVEYFGINFCGWQSQINGVSVEDTIAKAVFMFSGQKISIVPAGRTDAGVHAYGQVIHLDLPVRYEPKKIMGAINHFCKGHNVTVVNCEIVDHLFHARFSARSRSYIYKILNQKHKTSIHSNTHWLINQNLNIDNMKTAAQYLLGKHDFTTFRAARCQAKSPIRTISDIQFYSLQTTSNNEVLDKLLSKEIIIYIKAQSFLYHMVRNIVGSLVYVGLGKWSSDYIQLILNNRSRALGGPTAPAKGLYFLNVEY